MKFIYFILLQCFVIKLVFSYVLINFNLPVGETKYILPRTSIPHHYDIELNVNIGPDNFNYSGHVQIDISVLKNTKTLTLHSDGQQINLNLSYLKYGEKEIPIINYSENVKNNFLTLDLDEYIIPGNYSLILVFDQKYFEQAGLVLKSYNLNGNKKFMLGTFFQPNYARRIIPCYDEPNLKATFAISVHHPKEYHAKSNAEIKNIVMHNDKIQTTFQVTPKMSTYLLALGVSEYESLEEKYNDILLHVYVPKDKVQNTKFALNITRESLKVFEKLLKINYKLPKLDSILLPQFGDGGMENWGLIVYGDIILFNPNSKEFRTRNIMSPVELICHEVAHQWFGNLVTLDWWDYAWLNEGFAMYFSEICGDMILGNNSTIRFMDKHVIDLKNMLASDSNPKSSKSLNQHAESPYELMQKFDNYSYKKGSAIVRFMSLVIPNFIEAIIKYLNRFQYGSVTPNDLFSVLQETAPGINVKKIMRNWIDIPGHPLITFNITKRGKRSAVNVQQEQFNTNPNVNVNGKWWIPIILVKEKDPNFNKFNTIDWLSDTDNSSLIYIDDIEDGWVILNPQGAVFGRINYDLENWRRIITYLKGPNFEKIHPINRAQLIDDAHNLARFNKLPEYIVLDLLSYLHQEKDQLVKNAANSALVTYTELLKDTEAFPRFREFVNDICKDAAAAENILSVPNLKDLTTSAIVSFAFNKQPKPSNSLEEFGALARRIYTESDLKKIYSATGILARNSVLSEHTLDFMDQIEISYEQNKIIKKNFIENNLNEVNQWLTKRYEK